MKKYRYNLKENTMETIQSFTAAELVNIFYMFANDLKFCHLHAHGELADTVHSIAEELYDRANEDIDTLCEISISEGVDVPNFTEIPNIVTDDVWKPTDNIFVDMRFFTEFLNAKGNVLLDYLRSTVLYDSNNQSALDDIRAYWSKQINYLNSLRRGNDIDNEEAYYTYIDAYQEAVPDTEYDTIENIPYEDIYNEVIGVL